MFVLGWLLVAFAAGSKSDFKDFMGTRIFSSILGASLLCVSHLYLLPQEENNKVTGGASQVLSTLGLITVILTNSQACLE